ETTVWTETTAWSTTTLPGEETTIWATTTLPGEVTTLPPVTTTISGTTVTIPGSVTTLPGSTITLPASTVQLPGSTVIYTSTVSGPTSIETVVVTQVISTTIVNETPGPATTLTITSTAVQTLPPVTVTATATETTATTATETETETVSVSVCPSLTINPTYTPATPLPTDYTWGCPPGYLCRPKRQDVVGGCNFEAGLPAETYYCSPEECIKAPPLYDEDQYWGEPVVSDEVGTYNVSKYYFNLNPEPFGLNYSIFRFPEKDYGVDYFKRSFLGVGLGRMLSKLLPRQELLQDVIRFSDVCFDDCNGAALEAERRGKTPSLCEATSAFMDKLDQCSRCNERYPAEDDEDPQIIPPDLNQWLGYCDGLGNDEDQTSTREPITTSSENASSTRTSAVDPTSTGGDGDEVSTSATDSTTVTGTSSPGDDESTQTESGSDATSTSTSSTTTSGAGESGSESDDNESSDSGTSGPSPSPTSGNGSSDDGSGASSAPTPGSTPGTLTDVSPTGTSSPSPSPPVFTGAAARFGLPVHFGLIPVVLGLVL
ncbi:uncharacterized protein BDW70DRAFT_163233, partial [Aspergillus foveolatus]|uniref:uncharacterized protein n=1 Tax=Aspergillus foveolatus TaxID=210207 RepID=UPI003CCCD771